MLPVAVAARGRTAKGPQAKAGASGESAAPSGGDDGAGKDEQGAGDEPGDLRLEECELGVLREDAEGPCSWLAANRCYETKLAACSCVGPRDGRSRVCSSGFYGGEDSRTRVTCL